MLPRLFQLSHPVVLVDRDAGRPMLVRIKGLRKSPRSRGCQHRRLMLSSNTRFFLRILGSSWGACSSKVLPVMTLVSSPGGQAGRDAGHGRVHPQRGPPPRGEKRLLLRLQGGVHSPAMFGPRKPRSSQPPLPDCPSAGGKDTIPPSHRVAGQGEPPGHIPSRASGPMETGRDPKNGASVQVCASPGGPRQSKPVYVQNLLLPVLQCRPGRFHLIEPEFGSLPLFVGQVSGIWV
jgi:hypothetical protein